MKLSDINHGKRAHISREWNGMLRHGLPQAMVLEKISSKLQLPVPLVYAFVKKQNGYPGKLSYRAKRLVPSLPLVRGVTP